MIKLICKHNTQLVNEINEQLSNSNATLSTENVTENNENDGINLQFDAQRFLSSFKYMGIGMLGIFIITVIIIGVVTLLNKIKPKKKD